LSAGDIFTLCCTNVQFRWLAKDAVFKLPLIGPGMRWAGYVPVNRGNKSSHEAAMRASREWLQNDVSMLFFPEGTRSRTGELGAFKSGAFRLAEDAKKPILPIALSGTYTMLRKIWPQPSKIVIHVFPPMQREATETLDHFMERVRAVIATKARP
jgi:1-acyl-sn-glycerol-3-phosphate acyltransferase